MHGKVRFHAIGDDRRFPLAELINHVGATCDYIYDLGDFFHHKIELIEIKDASYKPERNITIIHGKGACPPEDSNGLDKQNGGNIDFGTLLNKFTTDPKSCSKAIKMIETSASNYNKH
jgi:hypothetical protein